MNYALPAQAQPKPGPPSPTKPEIREEKRLCFRVGCLGTRPLENINNSKHCELSGPGSRTQPAISDRIRNRLTVIKGRLQRRASFLLRLAAERYERFVQQPLCRLRVRGQANKIMTIWTSAPLEKSKQNPCWFHSLAWQQNQAGAHRKTNEERQTNKQTKSAGSWSSRVRGPCLLVGPCLPSWRM